MAGVCFPPCLELLWQSCCLWVSLAFATLPGSYYLRVPRWRGPKSGDCGRRPDCSRSRALKIKRHPEMVCDVVGFLCPEDEGSLSCHEASTVPTMGVTDFLADQRISDLILALPGLPFRRYLIWWPAVGNVESASALSPSLTNCISPGRLLDLDGIPILELREVFASDLLFPM